MFSSNETAPAEPITLPDIHLVTDTETQLEPPTRVLLHNDDVTTMEFVVMVLRSIFELAWLDAEKVMLAAHVKGLALVGVYPLEDAKYRVGQAHALARAEGFPLTLTIEPEEGGQ
jgi:ATP-dependent Clp protease adaptor protein ClpS